MQIDPQSDVARWRALVEKTLQGVSIDRALTRPLPGGLELPALSVDRPVDRSVAELAPVLARQGRWEISAAHTLGAPDLDAAIEADLARGVDSIRLSGSAAALSAPLLTRILTHGVGVLLYTDEPAMARAVLAEATADMPWNAWSGGVPADPIHEMLSAGAPAPTAETWDALAQAIHGATHPHVVLVGLSGRAAVEAGGSVVDELGLFLASSCLLLREMNRRSVSIETLARHLRVEVSLGRDQMLGIALVRALRLTWARVCAAFGEPNPAVSRCVVHGVQAASWLTRHDPWSNVLRASLAGFVGAVGGADAITLLPHDSAGGAPGPLGQRMAVNTQLLLAEESHLGHVSDPAAGSFTLDHLTDQIARAAWARLQALEAAGGLPGAEVVDRVVADVASARAAMARDLDHRKSVIIGVSDFVALDVPPSGPGMPSVQAPLAPFRHAASWEALRDAADACDVRPAVFLATWGPLSRHSARAMYSTNLLAAAGVSVVDPGGASDVSALVAAFQASGCRAAVICGADADYTDVVSPLAAALVAAGAAAVWVAGRPGPSEAAWRASGVSDFVFMGCAARPLLAKLHQIVGVSA